MKALPPGREALEQFIREYLSADHRDDPAIGCPSAALLDEIGRCDRQVRDSYTEGAQAIVDAVAAQLSPGDPAAARSRATGLFTLLVGSLQLARAVTDPTLSDDVLAAGISCALDLLNAKIRS
jgi:AcrR family transcriptional regulator